MNTLKCSLLSASILALSTGWAAAAPAVVLDWLNLRAGPGFDNYIVSIIPAGWIIEAGGCSAGWCAVNVNGIPGYVDANYLAVPTPAAYGWGWAYPNYAYYYGYLGPSYAGYAGYGDRRLLCARHQHRCEGGAPPRRARQAHDGCQRSGSDARGGPRQHRRPDEVRPQQEPSARLSPSRAADRRPR